MADTVEAIMAGFEQVFGASYIRLMCYFLVLHNIEKHLKILTKGGICSKLKHDRYPFPSAVSR